MEERIKTSKAPRESVDAFGNAQPDASDGENISPITTKTTDDQLTAQPIPCLLDTMEGLINWMGSN